MMNFGPKWTTFVLVEWFFAQKRKKSTVLDY
jgi:hypothetical protein